MIHVQIWEQAGNARVTDMTNAGKRGKTCATLVIHGEGARWVDPKNVAQRVAMSFTTEVLTYLRSLGAAVEFLEVAFKVAAIVSRAQAEGLSSEWLHADQGSIRGIDAPKPKLTVDAPFFSACADEDGITIDDKKDANNQPCMITSSAQTKGAAYSIAAKVWGQVCKATTFSEAGRILSEAGARLHYYCRMD